MFAIPRVSAALLAGLLAIGPAGPAHPPGVTHAASAVLVVRSSAFVNGARIPLRFCHSSVAGARNLSIPLAWSGVPARTRSFALVTVDRSPVAAGWRHWIAVDLPSSTRSLGEGASRRRMPAGTRELVTSWGTTGWGGPAPPPGTGTHQYETTVYALDVARLSVVRAPTPSQLTAAMRGHVLASGRITGTYRR